MANVFRMFQQSSEIGGGGRLPEWQSSHPDPGNRIAGVARVVTATTTGFANTRVGGPKFLRRLDGMVYGENPRLGFFQGLLFVHPDLAFTLRFPDAWKTNNANDAVMAISTAQDAMIELRAAQGTAAQAAQAFFAQEGLTAGPQSRVTVHGNAALRGEFTAPADQGAEVRGVAMFVEFGGATWRVTAYTPADKFATYSAMFARTFGSFARLTDAAALAVQQVNTQLPSSITLAELAMINGAEAETPLAARRTVKRVLGAPLSTAVVAP